ncbi:hypothetical protein BU15DRAFT_60050 [Melanogaster broomeanus]|nr:hypothetical protein BU15DRAFT_60050 [Melanogaster broomeanus]
MPPRTRRQRRDLPSDDEPVVAHAVVEGESDVEDDENAENVDVVLPPTFPLATPHVEATQEIRTPYYRAPTKTKETQVISVPSLIPRTGSIRSHLHHFLQAHPSHLPHPTLTTFALQTPPVVIIQALCMSTNSVRLPKASDSDPFGFFVAERALKAKRTAAPPRLHPAIVHLALLEERVPTNNEDIDDLYVDEPVAGPSRPLVPAAPLLTMRSTQSLADPLPTDSQPSSSPDPLRTPRKRNGAPLQYPMTGQMRRGLMYPLVHHLSKSQSVQAPVDVRAAQHKVVRLLPKVTRAQTKAGGIPRAATRATRARSTKRVKTSHQHIPTPSPTPSSPHLSDPSAPPTPVPRRRSARQAAVGAKLQKGNTSSDVEDTANRMKLRTRSAKVRTETKAKPSSTSQPKPTSKSKPVAKPTQKARAGPKANQVLKDTKGKRKGNAHPLEDVLGMSDDTREKYEQERRERLDYFRRLEGYQMQKENVDPQEVIGGGLHPCGFPSSILLRVKEKPKADIFFPCPQLPSVASTRDVLDESPIGALSRFSMFSMNLANLWRDNPKKPPFVERKDVFGTFQDEIARVTDEA